MPQILNPDADISNDDWNTSPLWDDIDEQAGEIVSDNLNGKPWPAAQCVVALEDGIDPLRHDEHILKAEIKAELINPETGDTLSISATLKEASEIIATKTVEFTASGSYEPMEIELTAYQASLIDDYTNLSVELTAGYTVEDEGEGGGVGG